MNDDNRVNPLGAQKKETAEMGHKGFDIAKGMFSKNSKGGNFKTTKYVEIAKKVGLSILIALIIYFIVTSILGTGDKVENDKTIDATTAAFYAATGQAQTSSYAEHDIQLDSQPIKVIIGENRRYNLEFDITDEDKQKVLEFLEKHQIDLTDENINFLAALLKTGEFEIDKYASKEKLESLLLFFKADIASKSLDLRLESDMYKDGEFVPPSFEEDGIPGIIRVNQYRVNPETKETIETHLIYANEDEFVENSAGKFTINEGGELVVVNNTQITIRYEYPEGYIGEIQEDTTTMNNSRKNINFKPVIAKSSLQFRFMETIMRNVNDVNFYQNIAKTVSESSIVLALKEEETEEIRETVTTYTPRIEEYYDFTYTIAYTANSSNTTTHTERNITTIGQARAFLRLNYGYNGMFESGMDEWDWNGAHYKAIYTSENNILVIEKTVLAGNLTEEQGEEKPLKPDSSKNYTQLRSGTPFNIKETRITKSYKQELEIKELKNWFMDYNITGYTGEAEVNRPEPNEHTPEIPEYIGVDNYKEFNKEELPQDDIINNFKDEKESEISNLLGNTPTFTWSMVGNNYKNTENISTKITTKTTTTTTTITKGEGNPEYRKQNSEGSFLYYLDKSEIAQVQFRSPDWYIFDALAADTNTVDQVNILKYLLYLYTGEERFNVEPIDLNSLVGTIDFASFGGGFNNIEYTVQFSWSNHDSYAKTVDGIEFYKLYGDKDSGQGNPTIGRGDINLCVHQDQLHRLNGKKGKYLINGTTVSTEEVDIDIYMKQQLGVSSYSEAKEKNINSFEIWVEAAPIDEIANNIWNEFKGTTEPALQSADISLKDQQINAIVALEYAVGYIYDAFINTYNDAIRCRFRN